METKTDRLFIIIPAYNERENIRQVLDDWYPVIQAHSGNGESRLVVIDDGSKDDTYIIMQEYAKEHPLFSPITKTNSGHGATVLYGYHYALDHWVQILIFQTVQMVRHFPLNLNSFGIRGKHGIWSLGGETTVRMAAVVSLLLVFYAL